MSVADRSRAERRRRSEAGGGTVARRHGVGAAGPRSPHAPRRHGRRRPLRDGAEQSRGVVLKKSGGTPETRLRQRFTVTQNINSAVLKLSYTAFQ